MTDRSKFEEMLERLVNEDRAGAEELFHEIVVEKSREIYQSILEAEDQEDDEDLEEASEDDEDDEDLEEASEEDDEEDEELDEMFGLDEFAPEAADDMMGGDATDDMMGDVDVDGMGGDEAGEGDIDSRVDSLEDELEALRAEFEKLMAGEEDEPEHDDMFGGDEAGDDEGEEADDEAGEEDDEKESFAFEAKKDEKKDDKKKKTAGEEMREYVEKVAPAKMGDNGVNTKSLVANKNDMGGTTANILASKTGEKGVEANKGQLKGNGVFKGTPKDMNTKNVNVPGAKNATKLSAVAKGHGAEKKGAGETADKSAGSMLNGAPKRAK